MITSLAHEQEKKLRQGLVPLGSDLGGAFNVGSLGERRTLGRNETAGGLSGVGQLGMGCGEEGERKVPFAQERDKIKSPPCSRCRYGT